jgi:hypothetical protein
MLHERGRLTFMLWLSLAHALPFSPTGSVRAPDSGR